MTATYTFDVFSSLDGFGSVDSGSNWTGHPDEKPAGDGRVDHPGGAPRLAGGEHREW